MSEQQLSRPGGQRQREKLFGVSCLLVNARILLKWLVDGSDGDCKTSDSGPLGDR